MKRFLCVPVLLMLIFSADANAWFFFFIPGSVTSAIGDALTGAEGENCVKESAKVGDILRSNSGNTATVKTISGTSSRCQNPALPMRALLTYNYTFNSKAGIKLPDDFEVRSLNDNQKFQGFLLKAEAPVRKIIIMINSIKREVNSSPEAIANTIGAHTSALVIDPKTTNEERLTINGMRAFRFEVTGKNKGVFGQTYTYLFTVLEGDNEYVVTNGYILADNYEAEKIFIKNLSDGVTGIKELVATEKTSEIAGASVSAPITSGSVGDAKKSGQVVEENRQLVAPVDYSEVQKKSNDGVVGRLRDLASLYKDGVITKTEYDLKKKELLKEM